MDLYYLWVQSSWKSNLVRSSEPWNHFSVINDRLNSNIYKNLWFQMSPLNPLLRGPCEKCSLEGFAFASAQPWKTYEVAYLSKTMSNRFNIKRFWRGWHWKIIKIRQSPNIYIEHIESNFILWSAIRNLKH